MKRSILVLAFTLGCFIGSQALADETQQDEAFVLFPLADMDSEINSSLQTVVESGAKRPVLVIQGDALLPQVNNSEESHSGSRKPLHKNQASR